MMWRTKFSLLTDNQKLIGHQTQFFSAICSMLCLKCSKILIICSLKNNGIKDFSNNLISLAFITAQKPHLHGAKIMHDCVKCRSILKQIKKSNHTYFNSKMYSFIALGNEVWLILNNYKYSTFRKIYDAPTNSIKYTYFMLLIITFLFLKVINV